MEGLKTRHGGAGPARLPARKESEWPESWSSPSPPAQLSETDQRMSLETQNRRISLVDNIWR